MSEPLTTNSGWIYCGQERDKAVAVARGNGGEVVWGVWHGQRLHYSVEWAPSRSGWFVVMGEDKEKEDE